MRANNKPRKSWEEGRGGATAQRKAGLEGDQQKWRARNCVETVTVGF